MKKSNAMNIIKSMLYQSNSWIERIKLERCIYVIKGINGNKVKLSSVLKSQQINFKRGA
jgi:hypothetical protein